MQRYGITLQQIKDAISSSNANAGGEYIVAGGAAHVVRSLGLIGGGRDPLETAMGMKDPPGRPRLPAPDRRGGLREIRQIVLASTNNVPVRIDDVVEGGPLRAGQSPDAKGVVVGHQTRLGHVMYSYPARDSRGKEVLDARGRRKWRDEDDVVQSVVLLRKGEQSLPALEQVQRAREAVE